LLIPPAVYAWTADEKQDHRRRDACPSLQLEGKLGTDAGSQAKGAAGSLPLPIRVGSDSLDLVLRERTPLQWSDLARLRIRCALVLGLRTRAGEPGLHLRRKITDESMPSGLLSLTKSRPLCRSQPTLASVPTSFAMKELGTGIMWGVLT